MKINTEILTIYSEAPWISLSSRGPQGQNYLNHHHNHNMLFSFSVLFISQVHSRVFQSLHDNTVTDWNQKRIRESSCLLSSLILKDIWNITQYYSSHLFFLNKNRWRYIHTMEYYTPTKRNKSMIDAVTWRISKVLR